MRLPVLFSLLSLATWAASSPAGGGAVEELGGAVEQAATSASPAAWRPELEDLSSIVSPGRAAWREYLATLSTHPPPPLRYATRAELADIQHARFVEHPSVAKLGIVGPGHAFIGQTPKGRLVFKAPDLHGITMYVPAKGHIMADQLVARKKGGWVEVINWGPVNTHGFAPEDLHDMAIKTNRGYLVRDKVPMNRSDGARMHGTPSVSGVGSMPPYPSMHPAALLKIPLRQWANESFQPDPVTSSSFISWRSDTAGKLLDSPYRSSSSHVSYQVLARARLYRCPTCGSSSGFFEHCKWRRSCRLRLTSAPPRLEVRKSKQVHQTPSLLVFGGQSEQPGTAASLVSARCISFGWSLLAGRGRDRSHSRVCRVWSDASKMRLSLHPILRPDHVQAVLDQARGGLVVETSEIEAAAHTTANAR
ncbi:hypothetical protein PaG_06080 [Moesziomyces aphidis]|uniref:Uncharacterized protein n=1 Tax=Moesziomyces aphidis TaxID=84754 RepID=W3VH86_MOEAP|nr:hypothetical protein PaG_06080 [Moesziomyces aphidis]